MPISTELETPVAATAAAEPEGALEPELDAINAVVYVIESSYNHRDQDNRPASEEALVVDEGWFADHASADARCVQLNARNRAYYDTSMATKERNHNALIRVAEKKNLEAAAIRSAGLPKADVAVPPAFAPETFEKFFSGSNHTTYAPIPIRRSDHDGIARAATV
ncbi:hypothetical protein [Cryobacterium zhongshanensis]|uniref:Uncharacterized protein n=1 Tax=Cryobacterium zhongshanensis TaxID=2928153 RepID=A0AA41UGW6_9MICO|nr:hypothetical protein [Cryobacterium zhongshanensis]MCI4659632.1 hypothetical protein [Cryobacterium zhongshanensis]